MTDGEVLQQTLSGGNQLLCDIEDLREIPSTFITCRECGERVLRSRLEEHRHDIEWYPAGCDPEADEEDDDDDEPERVGSWYTVTLSYTVDYRFKIPAWNQHEAKDIAEDWQLDASPADKYLAHTKTREGNEITTADVPDDFDPYGSTLLWEVFEDDD